MAISNVNLAMSASSYGAYQQRLSSATKAELDRLGIPYDPNISEQEARALIANYKAQKSQENNPTSNFNKNHQSQTNDLYERAKALAQKLGLSFDERIDFKALLSLIEQAIEAKAKTNVNNKQMLEQLKGLSEELASIQAESVGASYSTTNKALEMSLEMLSLYNQNFMRN